MSRQLDRADGRPRVHIWGRRDGSADWSIGPIGLRHASTSPGGAVDSALEHLGCVPAVIIFEGQQ